MDITGVLHILCKEIKTKLGSFEERSGINSDD